MFILITAYEKYALEGYNLNVVDYLLKPIRFSRFLKAVNKLNQPLDSKPAPIAAEVRERSYFFFSVGKKKVKVFLDEILYIESLREYIRITTPEKNILTKFQLSAIEELLSKNNFIRIHRSFAVHKHFIEKVSAGEVLVSNVPLPVGRNYKDSLNFLKP